MRILTTKRACGRRGQTRPKLRYVPNPHDGGVRRSAGNDAHTVGARAPPRDVNASTIPNPSKLGTFEKQGPDSGLGFQVKVPKTFEGVPSSLGSGFDRILDCHHARAAC